MTREDMNTLKEFKRLLLREIKEINDKGRIEPGEIHPMYEVMDMIKDVVTVCAMEDSGYSGAMDGEYSGAYMRPYQYAGPDYSMSGYARNNGYAYDDMGMSGARGRDSMGRYTSRYSREGGTAETANELRAMLNSPNMSENARMAIQECLKKMGE